MQEQTSSNSLGERVPKLRFPEFEGGWICEKLSDFTERVTRKNTDNETSLSLTISSKDGLIDQISYFNKVIAGKDMSSYYLLKHGEYTYNRSYSVGYNFGSIKRLERYSMGALSTLYICFSLKKHNSDFIKVYFDSLKWYHEIHMIAAEGARNHGLLNVSTEDFFETEHWFPINIDEQEKIAKFFKLLEYKIKIQQMLLENLKLYKRGLLSKLFPQKDENVPQYRFEGFMDAWEQRKFGDCYKVNSGYAFKLHDYCDSGIAIVNGESIQHGHISNANINYLPESYLEQYDSFSLEFGDIVVGLNRPITNGELKIAQIPREFNDSLLYQRAGKITYKVDVDKSFTYTLLSQEILKYTQKEAVGSDQPFISTSKLAKWKMMIPISKKEQERIGGYFSQLDHLITLHQRKYDFYEKVKLALLQQMFV